MTLYAINASAATPAAPLEPLAPRPIWVRFTYNLASSSLRTAAWRKLQRLHALNLERGAWAVAHSHDNLIALRDIADDVRRAGGVASVDVIIDDTPDDRRARSLLNRACERLWDEFFNVAECQSPIDHNTGIEDALAAIGALDDLWSRLSARDIVGTPAMHRAAAHLTATTDVLLAAHELDAVTWCRAAGPRRRRVEKLAGWPLSDGSEVATFRIRPDADPLWVAAFATFESMSYRPSPSRPVLVGGSFRCEGVDDRSGKVWSALTARVERFEGYLR